MTAKDLFQKPTLLQIIEELKTDGVKFDKYPLADYEEHIDKHLDFFRKATGADDNLLADILENDRANLYRYTFHAGNGNGTFALAMVPMNLIQYAVLSRFPDKVEDLLSQFLFSKAPAEARKRVKQYNAAMGIVPEKPKKAAAAPKPKAVAPTVETGLKYSEYDEDYYAMLIERGLDGDVIVNPGIGATGEKDDLIVWTPHKQIYKDHKEFRFTDIFRERSGSMFISERVREALTDAIPQWVKGIKGPSIGGECYVDTGKELLTYYYLSVPAYKFIDKDHLKLIEGSKGIVYHGDSTSGLEDIAYLSFRSGVMAKTPEAERLIFEIDFHALGWWFCHKSIKERLEAAGATGLKFVRSMDMNWHEYYEQNRRASQES
ncbi:MAG: hypothetical protein LBV38_01735 [Alistipes sp.]|jgi:hypothetical protein|nr:hypothetical protein [Alistipes sp.]